MQRSMLQDCRATCSSAASACKLMFHNLPAVRALPSIATHKHPVLHAGMPSSSVLLPLCSMALQPSSKARLDCCDPESPRTCTTAADWFSSKPTPHCLPLVQLACCQCVPAVVRLAVVQLGESRPRGVNNQRGRPKGNQGVQGVQGVQGRPRGNQGVLGGGFQGRPRGNQQGVQGGSSEPGILLARAACQCVCCQIETPARHARSPAWRAIYGIDASIQHPMHPSRDHATHSCTPPCSCSCNMCSCRRNLLIMINVDGGALWLLAVHATYLRTPPPAGRLLATLPAILQLLLRAAASAATAASNQ